MIKNTAKIFYTVHVGSKAYFGKTRLRGNKKVATDIIIRELAYKEGEEYSNEEIDQTRTRLLNLRLFSAVTFNPDLESRGARDSDRPECAREAVARHQHRRRLQHPG